MTSKLFRLIPLLALPLGACEGCIDLEGYRIVPDAGSSSSSGGAAGSTSFTCDQTEGRIFAVLSGAGSTALTGACAPPPGSGIDVLALAPGDGACVARARITPLTGGASVQSRVRHATGEALAVAGSFDEGPLEFPLACQTSSSVALTAPSGSAATLFVARLRLEGSSFCTEWAQRVTSNGSARVHAFEQFADGSVFVAGSLGGEPAVFEGNNGFNTVTGGAFFAQWSSGGALRSATALVTLPGAVDAALAIATSGSSLIVAGSARLEDPACQACTGSTNVTDAARVCPVVPDAGGDGGDASSGADASFDAASDVTGDGFGPDGEGSSDVSSSDSSPGDGASATDGSSRPVLDGQNAFLLSPGANGNCGRFESFGTDRLGTDDAQAIFGISRHPALCRVYMAGLAGRDTWRLDGNDSRTLLAPGRDAVADGFLARFSGGAVFGCPEGDADFSLRLSSVGAVVGERALAKCGGGVVAGALVRDAAAQSLALERCRPASGCDPAVMSASIGTSARDQIVVMGVDDEGQLEWHGSFGVDVAPGDLVGQSQAEMAVDGRDDVYLLITGRDPPNPHNVELRGCDELLVENPPAGTWLVKLGGGGFSDRARCRWARHLD